MRNCARWDVRTQKEKRKNLVLRRYFFTCRSVPSLNRSLTNGPLASACDVFTGIVCHQAVRRSDVRPADPIHESAYASLWSERPTNTFAVRASIAMRANVIEPTIHNVEGGEGRVVSGIFLTMSDHHSDIQSVVIVHCQIIFLCLRRKIHPGQLWARYGYTVVKDRWDRTGWRRPGGMPCVVCREVVVGAVCATVHATDDYLRWASSHCARTPATANGDLARPPDPALAQPKPAHRCQCSWAPVVRVVGHSTSMLYHPAATASVSL